MIGILIILGIAVVIGLWVMGAYNGLVRLRNGVKEAWAQIDVVLKRRHDLIPNLVETAKGYMTHERDTLENITKARNLAQNAQGVGDQAKAEGQLSQALSNFYVVVENYPDLKANTNFLQLQGELTNTENGISSMRQGYNDSVLQLNNKVEMFPSNIIAGMFNFDKADFFEIEIEAEREVPKVSF